MICKITDGYLNLNLLEKVIQNGSTVANYSYLSDGTKLSSVNSSDVGFVYRGSLVYSKSGSMLSLESSGFGGGRLIAASGSSTPNYYVTDHLGSVRVVLNNSGDIVSQHDYYPFGKSHDNSNLQTSPNRYLFNGKESQMFANVPYLDYGARMYDADVLPWLTQDPLLQNYLRISPYAFCAGNPVRYVDPDGREIGEFIDEKGRILGNDGIDDGKLYVVKTTETSFNEGKNTVRGAGVSNATQKATENFIKSNSGNKEAFAYNSIAYDNSVEIEGSAATRASMMAAVSGDNGRGGAEAANNREYGGSIVNGVVAAATPGEVANPAKDGSVSIMLPGGVSTFHSHPSGYVDERSSSANVLGQSTTRHSFGQPPSALDVHTAGANGHYVFGKGNNVVYIYNSQGVQATLPLNRFVNPK